MLQFLVMKPKEVSIKVIRISFYPDIAAEYLTEGAKVGSCPILKEGDEFIYKGDVTMPEGFCPWAWNDINHVVTALSNGASYTPWNKRENETIVCCGDGIRPVSFLVKVVE